MKLIDAPAGTHVEVLVPVKDKTTGQQVWQPGTVIVRDFEYGYVRIEFSAGLVYQILMPCERNLELTRVRLGQGG